VDALTAMVEIPKEFIVPGDTVEGAFIDLARATVVRRAERRVAALVVRGDVTATLELLRYLNRLSSFCFVLEIREHGLAREGQDTASSKITFAKTGKTK
jgi:cob(I)alamin adenosyltransferase